MDAEREQERIEKQRASDMAATARCADFFNRCPGVPNQFLDVFASVVYRFWRA
jgi:hypothetical protein